MLSNKIYPGPKSYVFESSMISCSLHETSCKVLVDKLNAFISAILSMNLFSSVMESYTYKLRHLQFGIRYEFL